MQPKILFPLNQEQIAGRSAFGGCMYRDTFYYFFGEIGYERHAKIRQCTNEVITYNFKTNLMTKE